MDARRAMVVAALLAGLLIGLADGSASPLTPPRSLATGGSPGDLVAIDLFGNGDASHLVTANTGTGDLSLFINGNDAYSTSGIPVGAHPVRLGVLDIDNDALPDLLVLNQGDRTLQLLLNNGDGTFRQAGTLPVGSQPRHQIGWKQGRRSHIAVSNQGENTVSYFVLDADGSVAGSAVVPVGLAPTALLTLDSDGDKLAELLVLNAGANTVSVIRRSRDTIGLPTGPVATVAVGEGAISMAGPIDLDGDGRPDVVVVNHSAGTLSVLRSRGLRSQGLDVSEVSVGSRPDRVNWGDFNRDGLPDLITSNSASGTLSVLVNQGNGAFAAAVDYPVGTTPGFPTVIDLDGDGIDDVVVAATGEGMLAVLKGAGDATFAPFASLDLRAATASEVTVQIVDAARDGNPGFAVLIPASDAIALIANPLGGFVRVIEYRRARASGGFDYLLTPKPLEIRMLDAGRFAGWERSGAGFRAYARAAGGTLPVCRFFSPALDAHFHSPDPDACAFLEREQSALWGNLEAHALFHLALPISGRCRPGFTSIHHLPGDAAGVGARHAPLAALQDAPGDWLLQPPVRCAPS